MIVREATFKDRVGMMRLGRHFIEASGLPITYDAIHADHMARLYIGSETHLASVLEAKDGAIVGMLLAAVGTHQFAPVTVASEVLWWIEPEHRGHGLKMIRFYLAWATAKGARFVGLSSRDERTGQIYGRFGFQKADQHWVRFIDGDD